MVVYDTSGKRDVVVSGPGGRCDSSVYLVEADSADGVAVVANVDVAAVSEAIAAVLNASVDAVDRGFNVRTDLSRKSDDGRISVISRAIKVRSAETMTELSIDVSAIREAV